jgi:hypothetical protein
MIPRYLYLINDSILLDKIVFNNGKSEENFYQIHADIEIVNRDNISRRLNLKIQLKYRDTDSRIFLAFSDFQVMENIRNGKNENDGDNGDNGNNKNFLLMR